MSSWSRVGFVLALVALLCVVGGASAAPALLPSASSSPPSQITQPGDVTALEPNTTYRIDVQPNGDARWTINRSFRLENASHREGFETIAAQFEAGELTNLTVVSFERAIGMAESSTGREMSMENVTRDARTSGETGQLLVSFTWTKFGYEEDDRIHVDDAFQTEPQWFPELSERETLIIARPPDYQYNSVSTPVQNGLLRWKGPHTFDSNRPYAVFNPSSTGPPIQGPGLENGTPRAAFVLGGLALVGVLVILGYAARVEGLPWQGSTTDTESGTSNTAKSTQTDDTAEVDDSTPTTGAERKTIEGDSSEVDERDRDGAIQGAIPASKGETTKDDIDEELLSDEERVERLLRENSGRMKQARIVEETGGSNAKGSQLLSAMAEEGRIEKLRIGRENLISFPDEEPEQ